VLRPYPGPVPDQRRGLLLGITAYGLWGLFPLYWPLLEPANAVEILGHRIVWSALTMGALVMLLGRSRSVRALVTDRRRLGLLTLAAVIITVNWATYIYGVNSGHVVETSLGYFINPLVTVLMGVVILGERMRPLQWGAVAIAGLAVLVLAIDYGRPPWVALVLAFTFGTYGLLKKTANVGAVESLTVETAVIAPLAAAYVGWLMLTGSSTFISQGPAHTTLLMLTGVITAIPLICFGAAATRIPLTTLGLLQYLAPVLQFLTGVLLYGEDMPASRWVGFMLVWLALVVFTVEATTHHRRQLRLTALASAI
jgi:chloramphenicol-sensitive protein RarD